MAFRDRVIADIGSAHRFLSVQAAAAGLGLIGIWEGIPDDLKTALPTYTPRVIAVASLGLVIIGRLIKQGDREEEHHG
jgi:hypothetical protein